MSENKRAGGIDLLKRYRANAGRETVMRVSNTGDRQVGSHPLC